MFRKLLSRSLREPAIRARLAADGVHLPTMKTPLCEAMSGLDEKSLGWANFLEFCQYACTGMDTCVMQRGNEMRLRLRASVGADDRILADPGNGELFTPSSP